MASALQDVQLTPHDGTVYLATVRRRSARVKISLNYQRWDTDVAYCYQEVRVGR